MPAGCLPVRLSVSPSVWADLCWFSAIGSSSGSNLDANAATHSTVAVCLSVSLSDACFLSDAGSGNCSGAQAKATTYPATAGVSVVQGRRSRFLVASSYSGTSINPQTLHSKHM